MAKININNDPPQGSQKITLGNQIKYQNSPPKVRIDPAAPIKSTNPQLLIKSTFGINFIATEIYKGRIPINDPDESPISRKSKLGTSIFSDLQFVEAGGVKHIPIDCALFDIHQPKQIVRTPIQGRKGGRIKEYIGEDDFDITIRGVICGDNGVYPLEAVKNLVRFCRYDQSLGIISQYLNEVWDISEIVIYDYRFEMPEGSQSYQKFEIQAWSDKPVEILIKEAKSV